VPSPESTHHFNAIQVIAGLQHQYEAACCLHCNAASTNFSSVLLRLLVAWQVPARLTSMMLLHVLQCTRVHLARGSLYIGFADHHVLCPLLPTQVFDQLGQATVEPVLSGISGTVFAYGVTSSGKTHTMMGSAADPGLVPRSITALFNSIKQQSSRLAMTRASAHLQIRMHADYHQILD